MDAGERSPGLAGNRLIGTQRGGEPTPRLCTVLEKDLKKVVKLIAALCLSLAVGSALAGTINVPARRPAVTINIPDSWEPEETDRGVGCESPDKVATVFFEVVGSEKGLNNLLDDHLEWLVDEHGVKVKASSKNEAEVLVGGIRSQLLGYDAHSKEWGPAKVGFIFTPVNGKMLVTSYWISVKGFSNIEGTLNRILASVKAK
jgi:hypothetical protein